MEPILDGPPPFILFGFLMVLAMYIRQLIGTVEDAVGKMMTRDAPYPFHELPEIAHSRQRTKIRDEYVHFLNSMRPRLICITWCIFLLVTALACRIVIYAMSRERWSFIGIERHSFKIGFDFTLSVLLLIFVAGMWIMHYQGARRYEDIRAAAINTLQQGGQDRRNG
jgi:hypothetical protein